MTDNHNLNTPSDASNRNFSVFWNTCFASYISSSVLPTAISSGRTPRWRRPVSPCLFIIPQTSVVFTSKRDTCCSWRLLTIGAFQHRYQAVYNYLPRNEDELELKEGDIVDVMEKCDDGWFVGELFLEVDMRLCSFSDVHPNPCFCNQRGWYEV